MNEKLDANYYAGCNRALLEAVPEEALQILEVGCGQGQLGAALKRLRPERQVTGIEIQPAQAAIAAQHLDRVLVLDLEQEEPELEAHRFDLILFGDVLEHLVRPLDLLARFRRYLKPDGRILCSVPNVQHYSILLALLTGDFQYTDAGLLDSTHLRFFSHSTLQKMLLDSGYAPRLVNVIRVPAHAALEAAVSPLVNALGLGLERTMSYLHAYQYIVEGKPLGEIPTDIATEPLSLVVCVSDDSILSNNLLASPEIREQNLDVILLRNCRSAAEGHRIGLEKAQHPLVVIAHQDVYLPRGWCQRAVAQYRQAERLFGPIGVAGVYGVSKHEDGFVRVGKVVDRDNLLDESSSLPMKVHALDEPLLIVSKTTPIPFDAELGFHFYGTDICLRAATAGLSSVVLDALCFHNSRAVGHSDSFYRTAPRFRDKWASALPFATPRVRFAKDGTISGW